MYAKIFSHLVLKIATSLFLVLSPTGAFAQEPAPLSVYGELPGIGDVAISDSGNFIALTTVLEGQSRLIIFNESMTPVRVISTEDMKVRSIRFIGDESVLLIRSETVDLVRFTADQAEFYQGMVIPVDTSREIEVIFAGNRNIDNAIFRQRGIRQIDGKWYGFFGSIAYTRSRSAGFIMEHTRPTLFRVDLESLGARHAADPAAVGFRRDWLVDGDGEVVVTFDIQDDSGAWSINKKSGRRIVEGRNPNGNVGLIGLGYEGTSVIYSVEDRDIGLTYRFEVPIEGGQAERFLPGIAIERFFFDDNSGRIIGYLERSIGSQPVFFDPELQRRARLIYQAFAGSQLYLADWADGLTSALVHTSGNDDSGSWFSVDVNAMSAEPLGYDRPQLPPSRVGHISRVEYSAQDGLGLDGILTLPPGHEGGALPVIAFPHGGPHSRDTETFDWWAQAMASRGYAVFQPNFRGSTGRGEEFMLSGHGEWGRKMQTDISDGLAHLAEQGIIDPQRACIVGASYGGYAALVGVTIQQGLYKCAVSYSGVSDLSLRYRNRTSETRSDMTRVSLQDEFGPREGWDEVSPRMQAANANAPILLLHGRDDSVVDINQSQEMAEALSENGKFFEYIELEGEDHWLSQPETRIRMLEETMDFVLEHNPPD